jgi:hypothetical protein
MKACVKNCACCWMGWGSLRITSVSMGRVLELILAMDGAEIQ